MVQWSCSSAPMSSRTSSTAHKSPRRIPVCCSSSVRGSHIHVHFRPSRVHCCNRVLCSTYKCSPLRVLFAEFSKFLTKECCLVWPLPSRLIPKGMFFDICCNEVIWLWILNIFISTRDTSFVFTNSIILSRVQSCT